jgi:hypothetical protein
MRGDQISDFAVQILTIIFYPADRKIADDSEEVTLGFTNKNSSPMSDLSKGPDSKADPIQMPPLSFSKVSMSSELSLHFCGFLVTTAWRARKLRIKGRPGSCE